MQVNLRSVQNDPISYGQRLLQSTVSLGHFEPERAVAMRP
jgi:hypothetical protein